MTTDYQHCLGSNGRCYTCGEFDPRSAQCKPFRQFREACCAAEARAQFHVCRRADCPAYWVASDKATP
jgi:hypothetical protein